MLFVSQNVRSLRRCATARTSSSKDQSLLAPPPDVVERLIEVESRGRDRVRMEADLGKRDGRRDQSRPMHVGKSPSPQKAAAIAAFAVAR